MRTIWKSCPLETWPRTWQMHLFFTETWRKGWGTPGYRNTGMEIGGKQVIFSDGFEMFGSNCLQHGRSQAALTTILKDYLKKWQANYPKRIERINVVIPNTDPTNCFCCICCNSVCFCMCFDKSITSFQFFLAQNLCTVLYKTRSYTDHYIKMLITICCFFLHQDK